MLSGEHIQAHKNCDKPPGLSYSDFLMTKKNAAAVQLGRRGGKATARKRNAEERSEQARKAALARWAKTTNKDI
jgi:hypothetical protein